MNNFSKVVFKGRKSISKKAIFLMETASEYKPEPWPERKKQRKIKGIS